MDDREILAYTELRASLLRRKARSLAASFDDSVLVNEDSDVIRLRGRVAELRQLASVIRSKSMLKHNSRMRRAEELRKKARDAHFAKLKLYHKLKKEVG